MGIPTGGTADQALTVYTGSDTGTKAVALGRILISRGPDRVLGDFNWSIWGTFTGTVSLERSFDGGVTYLPLTYSDGSAISWTAPISTTLNEFEHHVYYQVRLVGVTGTVNWRLSQ